MAAAYLPLSNPFNITSAYRRWTGGPVPILHKRIWNRFTGRYLGQFLGAMQVTVLLADCAIFPDPFEQDDFPSWEKLTAAVQIQIVGCVNIAYYSDRFQDIGTLKDFRWFIEILRYRICEGCVASIRRWRPRKVHDFAQSAFLGQESSCPDLNLMPAYSQYFLVAESLEEVPISQIWTCYVLLE